MGFLVCVVGRPEPRIITEVHDFFMGNSLGNLHIGNMIRCELDRQGRKMEWFAAMLNCDRSNAYKILKRKNIDLLLLIRISEILDHDFLNDCRGYLCK